MINTGLINSPGEFIFCPCIRMTRVGRIYLIACSCCDRIYIGSTSLDLRQRLSTHFNIAKQAVRGGNNRLHLHMLERGRSYFSIELLSEAPVANNEELELLEESFITSSDARDPGIGFNYRRGHRGRARDPAKVLHHRQQARAQYAYNKNNFHCELCGIKSKNYKQYRAHMGSDHHARSLLQELPFFEPLI